MKSSTRKSKALSLVPSAKATEPDDQVKTASLKESFEGWLSSVAPTLLQSTVKEQPAGTRRGRRSLTSTEITRVNRATVRESNAHRHWPPEVVLSFLAADVIKSNKR